MASLLVLARKRFGTGLTLSMMGLLLLALPAQAQQREAAPSGELSQAVGDVAEAVRSLSQAVDALSQAVGGPTSGDPQMDVRVALREIRWMGEKAMEVSRTAEKAESVGAVKRHADHVFALIWGVPSGLAGDEARGAANVHGWKVRWQTTFTDFDSSYAARYGGARPEITDPQQLGIVGRGRHVRKQLEAIAEDSAASADVRQNAEAALASLNNVIGWMRMDDGVTKGERQPRVDLTREWDAPSAFWNSTADTGWLHEAYAQALNILKTDYEGDVAEAQKHAAGMTKLLAKALEGVDADGDGTVQPVQMEGGLNALVGD